MQARPGISPRELMHLPAQRRGVKAPVVELFLSIGDHHKFLGLPRIFSIARSLQQSEQLTESNYMDYSAVIAEV